MFRTSRPKDYEICLCGYKGMYFAKLNRNIANQTFELLVSEKESYFEKEEKRIVYRGMEYAPEKFIVCL